MAVGNAIVNTARFKPLSYDEWAAPLKEISSQHAAAEKALDDISSDAAQYERYIMNNPNSSAAIQYRNFIDNIDRQTEALLQSGITPQSRADIINLKREYNRSIKPIKTGIALYQKAAEKRAKDAQKGIIGPDITAETYIDNPDYIDNYTTIDSIVKDATNTFKSLKGYSNNIEEEDLGNGITALSIPQSYSSEDYINAFEGKANAPEELVQAINTLKNKYFQFAGTDENMQTLIDYAIKQGAGSSIANPKVSFRKTGTSTGNRTGVYTNINIPQFKGYTPSTTDDGEVLYKKDGSYYRMLPQKDGKYLPQAVTGAITIDGKTFMQKSGGNPGVLTAEPNVPTSNEYSRGFTINFTKGGRGLTDPLYKDTADLGEFNNALLKPHVTKDAKIMTYDEAINSSTGLPDSKARNAVTEHVRNILKITDKKDRENLIVEMVKVDGGKNYIIHVLEKNPNYIAAQQSEEQQSEENVVEKAMNTTFGN